MGGRDRYRELNDIGPRDAGRIAFWQGRSLFANPGVGVVADDWRAGWNEGAEQLRTLARVPADVDVVALLAKQPKLLEDHRPRNICGSKRRGVYRRNRMKRAPYGTAVPVATR